MRLSPLRPRSASTSVLLCRELSDPLPCLAASDDVKFEWADASGIARLAAEPQTRSREAIHRSLAAGHRCLCAVRGGEILAYGWVSFNEAYLCFGETTQTRVMGLPAGEAFGFDLFTSPMARRAGIGLGLAVAQAHRLCDEGFARVWVAVDIANAPSLRLFRGLGTRPLRLAYSFQLGPWRRTFVRPPRDVRQLDVWFNSF